MDENLKSFFIDDTKYQTKLTKKFIVRKEYKQPDNKKIHAFIPGTIKDIFVKNGQQVKKGTVLLILEAMKMKNNVMAPIDGTIKKVYVSQNDIVSNKQLILEFE